MVLLLVVVIISRVMAMVILACLPLSPTNVLHAPKIIKNLISVRKFTIDNSVIVEFDPFGFSVKDF